ncbi:hypothetical protein DITRI_Ditri17bG0124900 [Diplodiscus trichospermus]
MQRKTAVDNTDQMFPKVEGVWTLEQIITSTLPVCFQGKKKMVCSPQRVVIFLIFFGLLTVQLDKVSGLRSIDDHVFRHSHEEHGMTTRSNQRVPKAADTNGMSRGKKLPSPGAFDPNQASKRRFRRGADPIHNKS